MRVIRDEHFITFEMLSASRRFDASWVLTTLADSSLARAGPTSAAARRLAGVRDWLEIG